MTSPENSLLEPIYIAVIEEEEEILASVLGSIEKQCVGVESRFQIEKARSRELTENIVRTRDADDKQQLASDERVSHRLRDRQKQDAENLADMVDSPYFGRMVLLDTSDNAAPRKIEYKIGYISNPDCNIIDWRKAPVAKLYYEYAEGEEYCEEILGREREGLVTLKRKLKISSGELIEIRTPEVYLRKVNSAWQKEESASGVIKASSDSLPDVLSLVTPEQFRLITTDSDQGVFLQGVAGSGKTTVGLYRLQWQISRQDDTNEIKSGAIVATESLKRYVEKSAQQLNLDITVDTYAKWIAGYVYKNHLHEVVEFSRPQSALPPGYARLKRSEALYRALEDYVASQKKRLLDWMVSSQIITESWQNDKKLQWLLDSGSLAIAQKICRSPQCISLAANDKRLEDLTHLQTRLSLYDKDIEQVLGIPANILAHDKSGLIDRSDISAALERTRQNRVSGQYDFEDDTLVAALHFFKMRGAVDLNCHCFEYLLVDEVQELSAIELAVLLETCRSKTGMTLVGDTNQQTDKDASFPGWQAIIENWKTAKINCEFSTLEVSHRYSIAIQNIAAHVSGAKPVRSGRKGPAPYLFYCLNEEQALSEMSNWVEKAAKKYNGNAIAVLCCNRNTAQIISGILKPRFGHIVRMQTAHDMTLEEGIIVAAAEDVKGLEFPAVALWNPSRHAYPNNSISRAHLYTAITRAQNHLCLSAYRPLSMLLPDKYSKLWRLIDHTIEIEENGD